LEVLIGHSAVPL